MFEICAFGWSGAYNNIVCLTMNLRLWNRLYYC